MDKIAKFMFITLSGLVMTAIILIFIGVQVSKSNKKYNPDTIAINSILRPYVKEYKDSLEANDIRLPWGDLVRVKFGIAMPNKILGISWGMDMDNLTFVEINYQNWLHLTHEQKRLVMFHELSHDVFNLKHFDTPLMDTPMPKYVTRRKVNTWLEKLIEHLNNK